MEIRKNWNKFPFKKLGAILCLFLFGIVTFVSGNLSQVNAASSSTVLPVAKGGTGSNSASGARTNLNAQEKLVSGTNIKSVFGQSLLGSGNVIGSVGYNATTLSPGQSTYLGFGFSVGSLTINNALTLDLTNYLIKFKIASWRVSYCYSSNAANNAVKLLYKTLGSSSEQEITWKLEETSYITGMIATSGGYFLINLGYDGYQGLYGKVEAIR